jgi:hypothetical protein
MQNGPGNAIGLSSKRLVFIIVLGWFSMLGFDLFQNAGLFAKLLLDSKSAFLPPEQLFRRIPVGYLAFLLSTILLTWLQARLEAYGWKRGVRFGLKFGLLSASALAFGNYSLFPVPVPLLFAWFIGGTVQCCIVSGVIGSGLSGAHLGRLSARVGLFVLVMIVATMVLQGLGLAPVMQGVR